MGSYIPENYQPVEERLEQFWAQHPEGRIETELASPPANFEQCRYVARVWRHRDDAQPTATGWAFELAGGGGANRTNHEENCETSAIGRALANMGYAPLGKRPSREEMNKTARPSVPPRNGPAPAPPRPQAGPGLISDKQIKFLWGLAGDKGQDDEAVHAFTRGEWGITSVNGLSKQQASEVIAYLQSLPVARTGPKQEPQRGNSHGLPARDDIGTYPVEPDWLQAAPEPPGMAGNDRYTG